MITLKKGDKVIVVVPSIRPDAESKRRARFKAVVRQYYDLSSNFLYDRYFVSYSSMILLVVRLVYNRMKDVQP